MGHWYVQFLTGRYKKQEITMLEMNLLIKPASGLCNMHCDYCFYADEMRNRQQASYGIMPDEVMEQVIKKTYATVSGACSFLFQGGEPTLAGLTFYEKWMKLEEKYNQNHVKTTHALQTNGYQLQDEWCQFFAKHNFLIGLSVDGTKATHDAYRRDRNNEGTYLNVRNAADRLRSAGVDFNVLTVVTKKTAARIRRIYESYRRQGFAWQQYIACLDPLHVPPGSMDYSLTPELYGQFLIELFRLWSFDLYKGRQPYIRQFENYIGILLGYEPESCEQRGRCSFQNVIEADGSVYPCDFYVLDSYKLGNLMTDDFSDIKKRQEQSDFTKRFLHPSAACAACRYYVLCRGGCCRHREQPGAACGQNYFCSSYQMFFDACLPKLENIANCIKSKKIHTKNMI